MGKIGGNLLAGGNTHPQFVVAIPSLAWICLKSGEFRAFEWTDIEFN